MVIFLTGLILLIGRVLSPVNLIFDKATFRHWTCNIVSVVTLVPGAPKPLQALFLGAPKCAGGTGNDLRDSVLAVTVNKQVVKAEQIKGATTDGAIVHCSVGENLAGARNTRRV